MFTFNLDEIIKSSISFVLYDRYPILQNPDDSYKPEKKQVLQLFFSSKSVAKERDWEAAVTDFRESSIKLVTKYFCIYDF